MREIHVCWEWPLQSRPSDLWPLVSNTDRFNADSGVPAVEQLDQSRYQRHLKLSKLGVNVEWDEEPFEWQRPERFGVRRRYRTGPLAAMQVLAEFLEQPARLRYQVWATPRNWLGQLLVRLQLLESGFRFGKTVKAYDALASGRPVEFSGVVALSAEGRNLLERARRQVAAQGADPDLLARICRFAAEAPDHEVRRIRPYALADEWETNRRQLLELFLRCAHAGMFELQWDLLCPLCRGAKQSAGELSEVDSSIHCESCNIDFRADFDRSIELTFAPNAAVRPVESAGYCVGGPQNTPHIVMQQVLAPHEDRKVRLALEPGVYRFRWWGHAQGRLLRAGVSGAAEAVLDGEPGPEVACLTEPTLVLRNPAEESQLAILERFTWSDQAAVAAEVTSLQIFRDLFAEDSLRPAAPMTVSGITVLFTDIEASNRMYREFGDSIAFSRVLKQQREIGRAVESEGGAVVKSIGERTVSVFWRPLAALKAARRAQHALAAPADPIRLKAGIHTGSAIVATLNGKLDYFGVTVNLASHLANLSNGANLVASAALMEDPEVSGWMISEGVTRQASATSWEKEAVEIYILGG